MQCKSWDELEVHLKCLYAAKEQLERDVLLLQQRFDTRNTAWWKRLLFRLDGWPTWSVVARAPRWRPWHRWWRS